jgi:hypothetical protein
MAPTFRLTFITVAATLAYLSLAILGWGGFAAFFSHPALIALTIVLFALSRVAIFSGGNERPSQRVDEQPQIARVTDETPLCYHYRLRQLRLAPPRPFWQCRSQ